jgi:hypothetical protein
LISASFSDFAAKSKIPPELVAAGFEVGDVVGDGIDAFGVHGGFRQGLMGRGGGL